ncbi:MAG: branched-chain amino acid ABC transporter permease [Bdellovibrionales bacterium]|nr:branched-chain amino acid ABC transporter permease [Bdellovibrionales bacterium]
MKQYLIWLTALVAIVIVNFGLIPFLPPYYYSILIYSGVNIILAVSLNLVNGFTGQFSIGHAGFMSVGAYLSAYISIMITKDNPDLLANPVTANLIFLVSLIAGGAGSAIIGYFVGLPSLRLRGDYLAIVTLGFGEIIRVMILNIDAIGGARGFTGIPLLSNFLWVYIAVLFTLFFIWRLVNSAHGRTYLSVREDEIAAQSMGVNTTNAKVQAFVIGAFFAGIAGGLFAHFLLYLNPQTFDFNRSFEIIIMVVLGGAGSISGSVVAAIILTVIREALRPIQEITRIDFRMSIYSLFLIILMLNRPNGLFGTKEIFNFMSSKMRRLFLGKEDTAT